MPTYLTPGVYVEEIPSASKPIEGVSTSIAAFIGIAPFGPVNTPVQVSSWGQFERTFGDPHNPKAGPFLKGVYLAHAVYGFFHNGGNLCYVVRIGTDSSPGAPQGALPASDGTTPFRAVAREGVPMPITIQLTEQTSGGGDSAEAKGKELAPTNGSPQAAPKYTMTITRGRDPKKVAAAQLRAKAEAAEGKTPEEAAKVKEPKPEDVDTGEKLTQTLTELTLDGSPDYIVTKVNREAKWIALEEIVTPPVGGWPKLSTGEDAIELKQTGSEIAPLKSGEATGKVEERTGIDGLAAIDEVTMVCVPDIMTLANEDQRTDLQGKMISHCEAMNDRMAIIDAPPDLRPDQVLAWRNDLPTGDSKFAALYYPWLEVMDPVDNKPVMVPPCGHMAGVWARVDGTRGVHKAPANETVMGSIGLSFQVTDGEQETLNPKGVNCIRAFPGRGIRVWGARTMSSDPEWKYINVRRLFNFVSESINEGTQWAVFEPNDASLWTQLRISSTNFLTRVWRDGALFGASPGEAFYVKCDESTNPPDMVEAGQVTVEIGIAPVKPAEFVVFRISQFQVGAEA